MALPTASDNPFASLLITEGSAPSSPAAGKRRLYVLSSDHLPYLKDSSGTVVGLTVGGYVPGGTDVAVADGGTGASTASGARTNLGLVLGTDVASLTAGVVPIAQLATGTPTGSKFIRDDGTLQVPAGGGSSLTAVSATLGALVALNTSTYTDVLSISLTAGTWLVWATAQAESTISSAVGIQIKLWDGTNLFGSADTILLGGPSHRAMLAIAAAPIVLGTTTTVKISGKTVVVAAQISSSTVTDPVAKATNLVALQIA